MKSRVVLHRGSVLSACLLLCSCYTTPPVNTPATTSNTPTINTPPADINAIPDAVPRIEPLSKLGNPAFYDVMGQRYFVMSSAAGYVERGVASWYGPGFHQEKTSNGEPYDMYAMTAAHKTLPLPAYVQVTNLTNGKQVVLRVNDRGPFKTGRIIDLSYTAAAKLDMLRAGTALVEVRALTAGEISNTAALVQNLFVQAGAFSSQSNAENLATRLRSNGYTQTVVRSELANGKSLYRVKIGPVINADSFDRIVAELKTLGINDARLSSE